MRSDQIATYLQEHPDFFEEYADLLSTIHIPHPYGGRAIPISERQILSLREKNRALESKLKELIEFGQENDAIGERLHRLSVALLEARLVDSVLRCVYFNLREDFAIPHVALRLWPSNPRHGSPEFEPASEESRRFAQSLSGPYCVGHAMFDTGSWFGEDGDRLRSFAYVALKSRVPVGLLVLASEEPKRFYPEMGTLYVRRLGDIVGAALKRVLEAA